MLERLGHLGENIKLIEEIVAKATTALKEEVPVVLRRLRERQSKLSDLRLEAEGLLALATAMPSHQRREFLEPKLQSLQTRIEQVEGEISMLERSRDELQANAVDAVNLQSALQTFETLFSHLKPHEQLDLLSYLVEEVRIGPKLSSELSSHDLSPSTNASSTSHRDRRCILREPARADMRTGHSFTFGFPTESAAESAESALATPSPRGNLGRILKTLDSAAAIEVERNGQIVRGEALLHDDIDVWAEDGSGPTTASLWKAIETEVEKHGGSPIEADPGRTHDGSPLADLIPASMEQSLLRGEPGSDERIQEALQAEDLATTTLLGGYLQVPWTSRELSLVPRPQFYPDLAKLPWLRSLQLRPRRVCDLAGLEQVHRLESLVLSAKELARGERLEDLTALGSLTNLKHLDVHGSAVAELEPLARLTKLETVALAKTKVSDLSALQAALGLRELTAGDSPLSDLTPLSSLSKLEILDLKNTRVVELSPLSSLHGLRHLRLSGTKVKDLAPLRGLTKLERLDLDGTKVIDLSALSGLVALQRLDLNDTKVRDLSPLSTLTELEWLALRRTAITDVSPLLEMTRLQRLTLRSVKVPEEALAQLVSALPECKVVGP